MAASGGDLLRDLLTISRDFEPRLLRELRSRGHDGLRPAYARFLYLVWDEPRTLQDIAAELGLSRQAVSQTARRIEQAGYAERRPNPADGRSKLVVITPQGRAVDDERARESIVKCEAHYEAMVGADALRRFVDALGRLRQHLDVPAHPSSLRTSLGVLPLVALRARDELVRLLESDGHRGLTPAQQDLLGLVGADGARPVDLARANGVSRQAVSSTLAELEQLGYVSRRAEAGTGRGVTYLPTSAGRRLLADEARAAATIEAGFESALGPRRMAALRAVARELVVAIPGTASPDLEQLAARLRQELGPVAAAQLGALLQRPPAAPGGRPVRAQDR